MIETTIAGIWHSHAKSLLTFALIGGSLNAFQAQIVVDTPDLEATQKALEVKPEASGKEMIGVVLPLDLDFFEEAVFVEAEGRGVWSLELNAPGHWRRVSISTTSIFRWAVNCDLKRHQGVR